MIELIVDADLGRIVDTCGGRGNIISRYQRHAGERDVRESSVTAAIGRDRRTAEINAPLAVGGILGTGGIAIELDAVLGGQAVGVQRAAEIEVRAAARSRSDHRVVLQVIGAGVGTKQIFRPQSPVLPQA